MKYLFYSLAPFTLLFILALVSCLISYFILQFAGDILPLHKLISKGTQIFLILSIFPLRRYLSLSWTEIGFAPKEIFFKQLLMGLGLGLLTLMPVLITLYCLDVSVIDETKTWTVSNVLERLLIALFLATLISFAEEPLFRGLLLASLKKKMHLMVAIVISSTYYAALHFLKNKQDIAYENINFTSSFQLLAGAFKNWLNPEILSAFIALFIIGVFLSVLRTRVNNSLGLCIGCHASWVWQIKTNKDWFNTNYNADYLYLVSPYDGVIGSLVSLWMGLILIIIFWYGTQKQSKTLSIK